jgi:hypothetical protein
MIRDYGMIGFRNNKYYMINRMSRYEEEKIYFDSFQELFEEYKRFPFEPDWNAQWSNYKCCYQNENSDIEIQIIEDWWKDHKDII